MIRGGRFSLGIGLLARLAAAVHSATTQEQLVIANDPAVRAIENTTVPRGRVATIALWVAQIALAAMFLAAGGSKPVLLVATMLGAVIANLSLGQSPTVPLVLGIVAAAVAWTRRNQLQGLFSR